MSDPFSTFAEALSTLDVLLRACKGLYDVSLACKDAPQQFEQLRHTIKNVESVLRNLKLVITEYNSSKSST